MTRSSFPALVVAPLLLVVCIYPGQVWLAHALPGAAGLATIDPGLVMLNTRLKSPIPIDLILVPGLFLALYSIIILVYTSRKRLPAMAILFRSLSAVISSLFIILFCVAVGCMLSWVLQNYLPAHVLANMKSLAVTANLHLPQAGYSTLQLNGDVLSLLGLLVGIAISIARISRAPISSDLRLQQRRRTPLTREQRMTPYQRMLEERRNAPYQPISTPLAKQPATAIPKAQHVSHTRHRYQPSHGLCSNEPLVSLQPQAVNYRPLI